MMKRGNEVQIEQILDTFQDILPPEAYREGEASEIEWDSLSVVIAMANTAEKWGVELNFESVQRTQTPLELANLILQCCRSSTTTKTKDAV